jgi:hypothetical protein
MPNILQQIFLLLLALFLTLNAHEMAHNAHEMAQKKNGKLFYKSVLELTKQQSTC